MRFQYHAYLLPKRVVLFCTLALTVLGIFALSSRLIHQRSFSSFRVLSSEEGNQYLRSIITSKGPDAAWNYLKSAYQTPNGVLPGEGEPHLLSHVIGEALYARHGPRGIAHCDDTFTYGCFHGFVGRMVADRGTSSLDEIVRVCQTSPQTYINGCVHGVGHGIAETEQYNLVASLRDCDALFGERDECRAGVIMAVGGFSGSRASSTKPWYTCESLPATYARACAQSVGEHLSTTYQDTEKTAAACHTAASNIMTTSCIESLGRYILRRVARGDGATTVHECNTLDHDGKDTCLIAASELLKARDDINWKIQAGIICDAVSEKNQTSCSRY